MTTRYTPTRADRLKQGQWITHGRSEARIMRIQKVTTVTLTLFTDDDEADTEIVLQGTEKVEVIT